MTRHLSTVATVQREAGDDAGRAARAQLVVIEGPDMGRACALEARVVIVGTERDCTLVLTDSRVSRRHVSIEPRDDGRFLVRDLGSRNGTLYEGSRVTEASLALGATLKLGHSFVRIVSLAEPLSLAPSRATRFGELVGESLAMREVFAVLERAAESDVTVLLEGETGTGKELAARAIHEHSARRKGPFVAIDCSALPETLVESELLGHVRGAFTGAVAPRKGAFVRAHRGTLFLDELDSVPLAAQTRLLRALESRAVRPVGGDDETSVDVRVVAGARAELSACVAAGKFRPDLFYRLSVLRVTLPPLRARREDLEPLVRELLRRRGVSVRSTAADLAALYAHDWPGNVRELRNVVDRALALCPSPARLDELRLAPEGRGDREREHELVVRTDLPWSVAREGVLEAFERRYLTALWSRAGQSVSQAARLAGLDRKHLRTLLQKHRLLTRRVPEEPAR